MQIFIVLYTKVIAVFEMHSKYLCFMLYCKRYQAQCDARKHLISQSQTFDYWHKVWSNHSWTSQNKANYKGMFKLAKLLNNFQFSVPFTSWQIQELVLPWKCSLYQPST